MGALRGGAPPPQANTFQSAPSRPRSHASPCFATQARQGGSKANSGGLGASQGSMCNGVLRIVRRRDSSNRNTDTSNMLGDVSDGPRR
eukprot:13369787-Alexandrium_andersonii.AAC.1